LMVKRGEAGVSLLSDLLAASLLGGETLRG
jgi:hypothetical protein